MKDNLSIVISTILLVVLVVIFPLYNHFERQDDMSYNVALKATSNFVDEVLNTGYINQVTYDNFINNLSTTGNIYDVQLEVHRKIFVKTLTSPVANPEYEEQYLIDYNDDIFSKVSGKALNEGVNGLQDKKLKDGSYLLNTGDKIYVKMKNSSSTMAGSIFNIIIPAAPKDRIVVNYGGVVKNNAWKTVDTAINKEVIPEKAPPEDQKKFEYNFTGSEQKLKISFSGTYKLEVWGAEGGISQHCNTTSNKGGYCTGTIHLTKNQELSIYVGGAGSMGVKGGWNGGGNGCNYGTDSAGGGGATDIRLGGTTLSNRIIVAGGGGGNGCGGDIGGAGGGLIGNSGTGTAYGTPGTGGTQTEGGTTSGFATNGTLGIGGSCTGGYGSGAGGGGYYGGAAGYGNDGGGNSGGGGSSYYGTLASASTSAGQKSGNGYAIITYIGK